MSAHRIRLSRGNSMAVTLGEDNIGQIASLYPRPLVIDKCRTALQDRVTALFSNISCMGFNFRS